MSGVLKADGPTLAIVTLKLQESDKKMLKNFRLDGYFKVIVAGGYGEQEKQSD